MAKAKLSLVDLTQMYYDYSTDAPEAYGWWLSVLMLGHAMGYNCVHLIQPDEIRHNMYLILVGPSTLSRKSTSQKLARKVYPYSYALPNESSPEQFIVEMSENPDRMLWMGEFTKFLKQSQHGGYMSGMIELFNDMYDCPDLFERKLRQKKGEENVFTIKNAYLSVNSTVTHEMLSQYITEELVRGGFLARWILVRGTPRVRPRAHLKSDTIRFRDTVSSILQFVTKWTAGDDRGISFILSDKALVRYNEIEREAFTVGVGVDPFVGRYMDYIIKVADILLVSDAVGKLQEEYIHLNTIGTLFEALTKAGVQTSAGSFVVDCEYLDAAWVRIRESIEYAQELSEFVSLELPIAKLRDVMLREYPQSHSDIMRKTHVAAKNMIDAINTLIQQDWLIRILLEKHTKKQQVRTEQHYCLKGIMNTEHCITCTLRAQCQSQNS